MGSVGVRELRARLSECLRRVRAGELLHVTARGKTVAVLAPIGDEGRTEQVQALLREGIARWEGGKPRGAARPPRTARRPVADAVLEDRR